MKRYSLEELQKMAREYFDRFSTNKVFATSDGQFFLMQARAELHAGNNLKVYPIENEDAPEEVKKLVENALSVKELTAKLETMEDLNAVQDMLQAEVAGPNRKTAVKAIEERCLAIAEKQDPREKK